MSENDSIPGKRRIGLQWGSMVVWLVAAVLVALAAWAYNSEVDLVARASATVIASRRIQVIQSVDGGVLAELPVREGDRVNKGQVLATFEDTRTRAALIEIEAKRAGLLANLARLRAELGDTAIVFPEEVQRFPLLMQAQRDLFAGRRQTLRADLLALEEVVTLSRQELVITEKLLGEGDASQIELLRARRQVSDAQSRLANRRNQYVQDVNAEFTRAREELGQVEQQSTQRRQQLTNVVIHAPMSGIVKNVRFTTLGAVLRSSDELMSIVPVDDQMIVEAKVSPRDIAYIRPGLEAMIKFDAYDYTVFGIVQGEVAYVSADSMREDGQRADSPGGTYYRVHVLTKSPAITRTGRKVDVIPGMTATVDIRTGRRTVIDYLTKPITKTLNDAFHER